MCPCARETLGKTSGDFVQSAIYGNIVKCPFALHCFEIRRSCRSRHRSAPVKKRFVFRTYVPLPHERGSEKIMWRLFGLSHVACRAPKCSTEDESATQKGLRGCDNDSDYSATSSWATSKGHRLAVLAKSSIRVRLLRLSESRPSARTSKGFLFAR
jgi:hypothetical protein